jgi:AAA domain
MIYRHADLQRLVAESRGMIIEDMIQEETVNILVGDSGLGKSPLLVQMALCVAAGIPFLNLVTRPGPVLYIDYENSVLDLTKIVNSLLLHLNLEDSPENFGILHYPATTADVLAAIREMKPILVIIDALRGFDPNAEKDNTSAANCIRNIQRAAVAHHTAFCLLHHTRKPDLKEPPPKLTASSNIMDWLQQASGARSLINQTDARFGIEEHFVGDSDLLLRGHVKLRGETGPWVISRELDDEGEALGYSRVTGLALLSAIERDRFLGLPQTFSWKFAEETLFPGRKGGKSLAQLISRSRNAGLLTKLGEKKHVFYSKV